MSREGCPFPKKWFGILDKTPDDCIKPLLRAIAHYWEFGEVMELDGLLSVVLDTFISDLDAIKEYKKLQSERRKRTKANQSEPNATECNQTEPKQTKDNKTNQSEPNGHKISKDNNKIITPSQKEGGNDNNNPKSSPSSLGAKGEDLEKARAEAEERANRALWDYYPDRVRLPKGCRYDENIGPYEYRDAEGKRRYREGGPIVPEEVEGRPYYDSVLTMCDGEMLWLSPQDVEGLGAVLIE